MKWILALAVLIMLSNISRAEESSFAPRPVPKPTSPIMVDEFREISFKEEKERLKSAAEQIRNFQKQVNDSSIPIFFYGEKCRALKRVNRVKNYLVKTEGIDSNKIYPFYGGDDKFLRIVIYLLPVKPIGSEWKTDAGGGRNCRVGRKKTKRRVMKKPRRSG